MLFLKNAVANAGVNNIINIDIHNININILLQNRVDVLIININFIDITQRKS